MGIEGIRVTVVRIAGTTDSRAVHMSRGRYRARLQEEPPARCPMPARRRPLTCG